MNSSECIFFDIASLALSFALLKFDGLNSIVLLHSSRISHREQFGRFIQMFKPIANNQKSFLLLGAFIGKN
jgi:hypothetical protein